jgi:FkbM family methyltransferase
MYSQREEEIVILSYFKDSKGHLLSLGENDGKTFSNALALIEQGWSADLVEPCDTVFSRLMEQHTMNEDIWLHNVAVGTKNGLQSFYESGSLINGHDYALVSTLVPEETNRWRTINSPDQHPVEYKETTVSVVDFKTLLKNTKQKTFDFITIDIEGMELEVLRQMDLKELGCKMICVEYNGKNQEEYDNLIHLPVIYKNRTNIIYADLISTGI